MSVRVIFNSSDAFVEHGGTEEPQQVIAEGVQLTYDSGELMDFDARPIGKLVDGVWINLATGDTFSDVSVTRN